MFGAAEGDASPLRTRAQLDDALLRAKDYLDARSAAAVGIVAETLAGGTLQTYAIQKYDRRLRIKIATVDPVTLAVHSAEPLLPTHPHLYFTWAGTEGLAKLWFDTLAP